jgi:ABC-type bacteriocin/lantibiotic exporter with double-glycine peptidase domain
VLVVLAMGVQTVARLASPWPLKVVLDSVLGAEALPASLATVVGTSAPLRVLNLAVAATIAVAIVEAAAGYASAYYTASVGQWVAHDLRQMIYAHLQRLSMSFYDRRQVGPLISTITDDVKAVQEFASQSLVSMMVDVLTIVGVLVVMLSLNWNFTLIALSVTPLLALFVYRLRHLLRTSTHDVRRRQSELLSIVQEGLTSIRVVKAFAQGAFERQRLDAKSLESVEAGLRARRLRALLPSVVTLLVATGTAAVLWFGARLVLAGAMTAGALSRTTVRADPDARPDEHHRRPGDRGPRARAGGARERRTAAARTGRARPRRRQRTCRVPRRDVRVRAWS